jgi:hypothetical protein
MTKTRAQEKARSRVLDQQALATGEKTREQLCVENGAFAFPRALVRLDLREKKTTKELCLLISQIEKVKI